MEFSSNDLEEFISKRNGLTFWKEFTFDQLKLTVPGGESELADNIVWFGSTAFIIQMKERVRECSDPAVEQKWFEKKVMKAAVNQIKDSMRFLEKHGSISVANIRNQRRDIRMDTLVNLHKIIIYKPGAALPRECLATKIRHSDTAGDIHVFDKNSYGKVLETLIAPEEVRRYLDFRLGLHYLDRITPDLIEEDILVAYMRAEPVPDSNNRFLLEHLLKDQDSASLSRTLNQLADNIQRTSEHDIDYARIMVEFSRLPNSIIRQIKARMDRCLQASKDKEVHLPYRMLIPETNTLFMITSLHPDIGVGEDEMMRRGGFFNTLTQLGKFYTKADTAVGVQMAYSDGMLTIDWCLVVDEVEFEGLPPNITEQELFRPMRTQNPSSFTFASK